MILTKKLRIFMMKQNYTILIKKKHVVLLIVINGWYLVSFYYYACLDYLFIYLAVDVEDFQTIENRVVVVPHSISRKLLKRFAIRIPLTLCKWPFPSTRLVFRLGRPLSHTCGFAFGYFHREFSCQVYLTYGT